MRVTLSDTTLARRAGQFVWLGLNFDDPQNRDFLLAHRVAYTPTLYVLDGATGRTVASHLGGLTVDGLNRFLDVGRAALAHGSRGPADSALARGDALAGGGDFAGARDAYAASLRLAAPDWPARPRAVEQLTWALLPLREWETCAETAAAESPALPRALTFVRVVLAGLTAANSGQGTAWAPRALAVLEPGAREALGLDAGSRDDRFQLYQQLMHAAGARGDSTAVHSLGDRWLAEIHAIVPRSEDERTGLDVARVDAAREMGEPEREIPALQASERAMPRNYNASLRLAQLLAEADRYPEALAACDRGLARSPGPLGRAWLGETKAQVLLATGDRPGARRALAEAELAARGIVTPQNRESNLGRIAALRAQVDRP